MRTFDVSCDAEQQDDGSFTLSIKITGLQFDQAQQIAGRMKEPFRAICLDVLTESGSLPFEHRNLKDPVQ